MKMKRWLLTIGFILLAFSRIEASHWPNPPHLGIPPEVYEYLHEQVRGGPMFTEKITTCREARFYCDTLGEQMGVVTFYKTAEDRNQGRIEGWLGTGYFDIREDGGELKLGKMFMFAYADGRAMWHRQAMLGL